jgi:hypothetical protein
MFCHKLHAFFMKKILTSFRKKIAGRNKEKEKTDSKREK